MNYYNNQFTDKIDLPFVVRLPVSFRVARLRQ